MIPGPGAIKLGWAYFWSLSQKEHRVEKWDRDQKWACLSFMASEPGRFMVLEPLWLHNWFDGSFPVFNGFKGIVYKINSSDDRMFEVGQKKFVFAVLS